MSRTQTGTIGQVGGVATDLRDRLIGESDTAPLRAPESIPERPSRQDAIEAIVSELDCKPGQAVSTLNWIRGFVNRARRHGYETQYPTAAQMDTVEYLHFDAIMPHGSAPAPGSAADIVSRHLLDPALDETSLWHDREFDEVGSRHYCTVGVALGVIRTATSALQPATT